VRGASYVLPFSLWTLDPLTPSFGLWHGVCGLDRLVIRWSVDVTYFDCVIVPLHTCSSAKLSFSCHGYKIQLPFSPALMH